MADTTDLKKKYLYKVSTPAGVYLGAIPNVISPFGYNQLINSAGPQMTVVVGRSADTASEDVSTIETEDGLPLTTEDGATLTTEREPDLVGAANSNALIANDNLITVYEFSRYNPNGKVVFDGFIDRWRTAFGGSEDVEVTCLTNSQDLGEYLVPGSTTDILDQSLTVTDGLGAFMLTIAGVPQTVVYGQEFSIGAGVTNISSLAFELGLEAAGTTIFTVKLWTSKAAYWSNSPLAQATITITASGYLDANTFYKAIFPSPVNVTGATMFWTIAANNDLGIFTVSNADYGTLNAVFNPSPFSPTLWQGVIGRIDFKSYYSANVTSNTFTSTDPSTILTTIMASYDASGGHIALSTPSATGVSASYTFNLNTILEGIQKVFELGPSNWYWYVDPATNTLYYKAASTTADITFIRGRHIQELDVEATKEDIVNIVYFTGGDDGTGSNVYVLTTDTNSLVVNRRGLARLNDPKVNGATGAVTAALLAQNNINQHNAETYQTSITILDDAMDISTIALGMMVAISGFGTFVDNLLLQIVGINRKEDSAVLSLGTLPPRSTQVAEQIKASLQATQTVNNPLSPT